MSKEKIVRIPLYKKIYEAIYPPIKAILSDPRGLVGVAIIAFFAFMALFPQVFTPYKPIPIDQQAPQEFQKIMEWIRSHGISGKPVPLPPTPGHPLGIDQAWRDIWSRVVYGARVSLTTGLLCAVIATLIGLVIGSLAGYYGGKFDAFLMLVSDSIMMLPGLLLLILITSLFRDVWNIWFTILLISAISWPSTARAIRAKVLQIKSEGYVEASRCLGASNTFILVRHVWPQVLPFALARATILVAGAIVTVASLAFLIPAATQGADWGSVISDSYANWNDVISKGMWSWFLVPGLFIALVVIGFISIGEVLIEFYNPRLRRR